MNHFSQQQLNKISSLIREIEKLSDVEKLFLYLHLPCGKSDTIDGGKLRSNGARLRSVGSSQQQQQQNQQQNNNNNHNTTSNKSTSLSLSDFQNQLESMPKRPDQETTQTYTWILSHLEIDPNVSLPKQEVYDEYKNFCQLNQFEPLCVADFGKAMKYAFPCIKPRRLGQRGNSRYCYSGLRKRYKLEPPSLPSLDAEPSSCQNKHSINNNNDPDIIDKQDHGTATKLFPMTSGSCDKQVAMSENFLSTISGCEEIPVPGSHHRSSGVSNQQHKQTDIISNSRPTADQHVQSSPISNGTGAGPPNYLHQQDIQANSMRHQYNSDDNNQHQHRYNDRHHHQQQNITTNNYQRTSSNNNNIFIENRNTNHATNDDMNGNIGENVSRSVIRSSAAQPICSLHHAVGPQQQQQVATISGASNHQLYPMMQSQNNRPPTQFVQHHQQPMIGQSTNSSIDNHNNNYHHQNTMTSGYHMMDSSQLRPGSPDDDDYCHNYFYVAPQMTHIPQNNNNNTSFQHQPGCNALQQATNGTNCSNEFYNSTSINYTSLYRNNSNLITHHLDSSGQQQQVGGGGGHDPMCPQHQQQQQQQPQFVHDHHLHNDNNNNNNNKNNNHPLNSHHLASQQQQQQSHLINVTGPPTSSAADSSGATTNLYHQHRQVEPLNEQRTMTYGSSNQQPPDTNSYGPAPNHNRHPPVQPVAKLESDEPMSFEQQNVGQTTGSLLNNNNNNIDDNDGDVDNDNNDNSNNNQQHLHQPSIIDTLPLSMFTLDSCVSSPFQSPASTPYPSNPTIMMVPTPNYDQTINQLDDFNPSVQDSITAPGTPQNNYMTTT